MKKKRKEKMMMYVAKESRASFDAEEEEVFGSSMRRDLSQVLQESDDAEGANALELVTLESRRYQRLRFEVVSNTLLCDDGTRTRRCKTFGTDARNDDNGDEDNNYGIVNGCGRGGEVLFVHLCGSRNYERFGA
jgi:hypothetical protein